MIEGLSMEKADYPLGEKLASQLREELCRALGAIEGIETAEIDDNTVSVQYYPEILSRESIRRELVKLGVDPKEIPRPSNPFKKFVNRLAESNARNFGAEPLDCCKLNRNESPGA